MTRKRLGWRKIAIRVGEMALSSRVRALAAVKH